MFVIQISQETAFPALVNCKLFCVWFMFAYAIEKNNCAICEIGVVVLSYFNLVNWPVRAMVMKTSGLTSYSQR